MSILAALSDVRANRQFEHEVLEGLSPDRLYCFLSLIASNKVCRAADFFAFVMDPAGI